MANTEQIKSSSLEVEFMSMVSIMTEGELQRFCVECRELLNIEVLPESTGRLPFSVLA